MRLWTLKSEFLSCGPPPKSVPRWQVCFTGSLSLWISKTWRNLKSATLDFEIRVWATFNLIILHQLDLKFRVSWWISKTSRNLKSAPQKLVFKVPKRKFESWKPDFGPHSFEFRTSREVWFRVSFGAPA